MSSIRLLMERFPYASPYKHVLKRVAEITAVDQACAEHVFRAFQEVGGKVFDRSVTLQEKLKISFPEAVRRYENLRKLNRGKARKASAAAMRKAYPFKPEWMLRSKFEVQGGAPGLGKRR